MNARLRPALVLIAAAVAMAALAVPAAAKPTGGAGAAAGQLQRELNEIVADRGGPPGIATVIVRGRSTTFLRAGVGNVKTKTPIRIHDRIRIASVAKALNSFVTVGLGGVANPLKLDSTVGSKIPGLLPNAEAVTVEQLLDHTSGLPDYIKSEAFAKRLTADPAAYVAPKELLGYVAAEPLLFPPGSQYTYSDSDNIAVGLMDEATAGISYEALLKRDVFGPIGMPGSSLPRTVRMPVPFVHGYSVTPGKAPEDESELINPAGAWASGGIVSTPADLAKFTSVYVPTVLPVAKRLPVPFRPGSSDPPGPGTNQAGIGIFSYESRCGTVYGHTGSFPGYRLFIGASATGNRVVVMVANAQVIPGEGSAKVSNAIRRAQVTAVCAALR